VSGVCLLFLEANGSFLRHHVNFLDFADLTRRINASFYCWSARHLLCPSSSVLSWRKWDRGKD